MSSTFKPTKKYVVSITGIKHLKKGEISIVTYQSPVIFTTDADTATGKAIKFFIERNPGYSVHQHITNEI